MFKRYALILAFTLTIVVAMASALSKTIEKAIQSATDDAAALQLIKEYVSQTDDIEDLRVIQNYWLQLDEAACLSHFKTLKDKNPKSEKYIYLWARTLPETTDMMKQARKLIKKHPNFEYGYRLLLAPYQKELFVTELTDEIKATPIYKDFLKDRQYFDKYLKKFPESNDAIYLKIELDVWEKRVDEANKLVSKAVTLNSTFLTWQFFTNFYLQTNQLQLLQAYIRKMISESKQAATMTPADMEIQFVVTYLGTLFEAERYKDFIDYLIIHSESLADPNVQQMALLIYTKEGKLDSAFDILERMIDRPNEFYSWLTTDNELDPLRSDPRWTGKMSQMKLQWNLGRSTRKAAVIAKKISMPAYAWELKDAEGKVVKLADLKGSVVVLDFWATWCGPCKMAMPVLDEWMKNSMPQGVKVYSINVWERDPSKALAFMQENGYGMPMLYGTNDLAQKYGFDGIPYLCIIDKQGLIRYEEKGFAPELKENLTFWVEDLLK